MLLLKTNKENVGADIADVEANEAGNFFYSIQKLKESERHLFNLKSGEFTNVIY